MLIADSQRKLEEQLVKENETIYQLQEYRNFCHPQEKNSRYTSYLLEISLRRTLRILSVFTRMQIWDSKNSKYALDEQGSIKKIQSM